MMITEQVPEAPYPSWFTESIANKAIKNEGIKLGLILAPIPDLFDRFMDHLSKTVTHDYVTKRLVFLVSLSAYTHNPLNLFLRGESSIGKTYNVVQALQYFPAEDVWMLGGLSPTALVHDYGILLDENDNPIDWTEKPNSKRPRKRKKDSKEEYEHQLELWKTEQEEWHEKIRNSRYVVVLCNKILVFLEAPHPETYNKLRPVLSHDKEEISYKFTDKTPGGLRTMHVVLSGWPACIFTTTEERYVEDLATRSFTHTPEAGEEKIYDANKLEAKKRQFPWLFQRDREWQLFEGYIRGLREQLKKLKVINPYAAEFAEHYPHVVPRCMRDFKHICSLLDVSALFHFAQRPILQAGENEFVLCSLKDLDLIGTILPKIEETTLTGLPNHILSCFHKVMDPLFEEKGAFTYKELVEKHNEVFVRKRSYSRLRDYVSLLADVGYVDTYPDPEDRRKILIRVIKDNTINMSDSVFQGFQNSFTREELNSWFSAVKNSVCADPKVLRTKITSDEAADVETVYKEHYSVELLSFGKAVIDRQNLETPSKPNASPTIDKMVENYTETQSDRISSLSSFANLDQLVSVVALDQPDEGSCVICGKPKTLYWQVEDFEGRWGLACQDCGDPVMKRLKKREG